MQTLYLIRHTQPDIAPGLCYGQLDIGVAASFNDEAARILDWLPSFDLIISSPLLRTRKLAGFLAQRCEVRFDARLMEKNFGSWEGREWDEIPRDEIDAWAADIMGYTPVGGESAQQLMQRVQAFLQDLAQRPQQHIALVAHGGSIRAILAKIADVPLTNTLNWQIDYGAVVTVHNTRAMVYKGGRTTELPPPQLFSTLRRIT
ncbi:MAG: alpha-ribazole phosphatase [Gallionellales bacterium RIFOXYB12_FULL_54_9]|nr:MAG: alpha-ribazole phosphatase [Gallionellales bacterium RIFOXYB12_FULL_54_9]